MTLEALTPEAINNRFLGAANYYTDIFFKHLVKENKMSEEVIASPNYLDRFT